MSQGTCRRQHSHCHTTFFPRSHPHHHHDSGIATAQRLLDLGAVVILTARNRNDALHAAPLGGQEPIWIEADLAQVALDDQAAQALVTRVRQASPTGTIDDVFHVAGLSVRAAASDVSANVLQNIFNVNTFAPITLTRHLMTPVEGRPALTPFSRIVLASSVQGHLPLPFRAPYSASKHALQAYFDSLRLELELGISVPTNRVWEFRSGSHSYYAPPSIISVCFGYVNTNLSRNALTGSGARYNRMDETTSSGISPTKAATAMLRAALDKKDEVWVAPPAHRLAMSLWGLVPSIVKRMIRARAWKQLRSQPQHSD